MDERYEGGYTYPKRAAHAGLVLDALNLHGFITGCFLETGENATIHLYFLRRSGMIYFEIRSGKLHRCGSEL